MQGLTSNLSCTLIYDQMYSLVVCTQSFFLLCIFSFLYFLHSHIMGGLSCLTMAYVLSSHSITPSHTCTAAAWWAVAAVLFIVERMPRVVGSNHWLPPFPLGACTPFSLTVSMFGADRGLDMALQGSIACWCVSHWAPLPLSWPGPIKYHFCFSVLNAFNFLSFLHRCLSLSPSRALIVMSANMAHKISSLCLSTVYFYFIEAHKSLPLFFRLVFK